MTTVSEQTQMLTHVETEIAQPVAQPEEVAAAQPKELAEVQPTEAAQPTDLEDDSLSDASSTSIEEDQEEEEVQEDQEEEEVQEDQEVDDAESIDDRDLPDNVIHSVTLQSRVGDLMTFTLRSDDTGLRLVDISGATPLTLSAATFEGIVDDLFLELRRESQQKQFVADQLELLEQQRQKEFETVYFMVKTFILFFFFMLTVVSIARVL